MDNSAIDAPVWLSDVSSIAGLLNWFIDRLDAQPASERKHSLGIKLSPTVMPALFHQGENADHLWDLIKSLQEDWPVFYIHLNNRRDAFSADYSQARLTLQANGEAILRRWLQRPKGPTALQGWRAAVQIHQHHFPGQTDSLVAHRIHVRDKNDESIIAAFVALQEYQHKNLSLRQLSSRCFWGDSKFLDHREDLLRALYPSINIKPRPVMINVCIPECINGILFIENQDSYTQAIHGQPAMCKNLILVYAAGFKSSAERIRQPDGVSLHFHSQSSPSAQALFEDWWFKTTRHPWPIYFWGDLDFSGMGILKALKQRFTSLQAWPPGYQAMLAILQQAQGHRPGMADKQAQQDPITTGCVFADEYLLPAIRKHQAFVDQEVVIA